MSVSSPVQSDSRRVWDLDWLTPARCRIIFALFLIFGAMSQVRYLRNDCPIDLSADEAHYWDWSRQLDLSYYSKGPLVAYIIRASCEIFRHSDQMWVVRFPAIVLAAGTAICTYWLTRKLFRSDRLALGVVLLTQTVPLFLAGAVAMTIDPPFIVCWALASCFFVKAVFDDSKWGWVASGLIIGIGFLAKYTALVWLPIVLVFCWIDPSSRKHLKTIWPWLMVVIALACTTQVWIWNSQHDWVSLKHVNKQIGASNDARYKWWLEPLTFFAGQMLFANLALVPILVGGVFYALSRKRREDPDRRALLYLVFLALPFFALNFLITFWQKVQPNWPAPAYFGWIILGGYFISTRLRDRQSWAPWRNWFWATVIVGMILPPIIRDPSVLIGGLNRIFDLKIAAKVDPTWRMRGYEQLGQRIGEELKSMPKGAFILSEDYQAASEMAFYVPGQPKTYCAGSYWKDPAERRRMTQFDIWPDRYLNRPELRGCDAIYIGEVKKDIREAFEKVEELPDSEFVSNGLSLRTFMLHRCRNFKGMQRPNDGLGGN